jgi:hypothetical protein
MRFTARVPYLGDEIEVSVPLLPNGIIFGLTLLAPFSDYLWKALALWQWAIYVTGFGNPYCN